MKKSKIILTFFLFISILHLAACSTGNKYYTYQIEDPHQDNIRFWRNYYSSSYFGDVTRPTPSQTLYIRYYLEKEKDWKQFTFDIKELARFKKETGYNSYTGPYRLSIDFNANDAEKIVFNKMLFRSKNKVIDLREKVRVVAYTKSDRKQLDGKNLSDFRNFGIINIGKIEKEFKHSQNSIRTIYLIYDDVDVVFKYDKKFTIEYNIDFEINNETINFKFTAPFKRVNFIGEGRTFIGMSVEVVTGVLGACAYICVFGCISGQLLP